MPDLLIGCGARRDRLVYYKGRSEWSDLVTLDINDAHHPDVVHDLAVLPLPFADDSFDEIHAYEVLEHVGQQGDWRFFFAQFSELWRILKPGGGLCGSCPAPNTRGVWGDPGHTRAISPETLTFLVQREYVQQVGHGPMTDYRFIYKADFEPSMITEDGPHFFFAMKAVKPSRIVEARPK